MPKTKKEKTWDLFSKYIRRFYADENGMEACCTCGVVKHWKEMQAGHFVDSRNNSVLFNELLVHPQCVGCNLYKNGNKIRYTLFMKRKYGLTDEQIEELDNLKFATKKIDIDEIFEEYKDKLVGLDIRGEK